MTDELNQWLTHVLASIRANDHEGVNSVLMENALYCHQHPDRVAPEDYRSDQIEEILHLMENGAFRAMDDASPVFRRFEADWAAMAPTQQTRVGEHIHHAYGAYGGPQAWFLMTEILGEYESNENALDAVGKLCGALKNERARAMLPHALEYLVSDGKSEQVRKSARKRLEEGRNDWSADFRAEVALSLWRLANSDERSASSDAPRC
jgi:hypothetical protein